MRGRGGAGSSMPIRMSFALILANCICILLISTSASQNAPRGLSLAWAHPISRQNTEQTASPYQPPSTYHLPSRQNRQRAWWTRWWPPTPSSATAVITALVLMVYGVIAAIMWHSFLVQERPHVLVANMRLEQWSDPINRTIYYDAFNYGKSPAWVEGHVVRAALGPLNVFDLPGPPVYRPPSNLYGMIPPNGKGSFGIAFSGIPLQTGAGANEDHLRAAGHQLFLYGYVTYRNQHSLGDGIVARLHRWRLRRTGGFHRTGFIFRFNTNNVDKTTCGDRSYWTYS